MIRSIIETILGEFGRQLLYFYEANAIILNSFVILYGLFMFLSWNNLVRVYRYLIVEVAKTIHLNEELNRKSTNKHVRESLEIPWAAAVKASPYPFIGRLGSLWPKRMSEPSLQMYFDEKDIVRQAIKLLKGGNLRRMTPSSRQLIDRERASRKGELAAPVPVTPEEIAEFTEQQDQRTPAGK